MDFFALFIGSLILIGVIGNKFFQFSKIPNPLLFMALGLVSGTILHFIQIPNILEVIRYLGTVAIILIIFEGGLELDIFHVKNVFTSSFILGFLSFFFTLVLVFNVLVFYYGIEQYVALIIGLILGGSAPSIIIPTIKVMKLSDKETAFYTLESTISELITIISVLVLIDLSKSSQQIENNAKIIEMVIKFLLTLFISISLGIVWSLISNILKNVSLSYMLTLSVLFILYGTIDFLDGEPILAILFFGLFMGNASAIVDKIHSKIKSFNVVYIHSMKFEADEFQIKFNSELSFLVRICFFFVMGLIIDFSKWDINIWAIVIFISVCCILGRAISTSIMKIFKSKISTNYLQLLLFQAKV